MAATAERSRAGLREWGVKCGDSCIPCCGPSGEQSVLLVFLVFVGPSNAYPSRNTRHRLSIFMSIATHTHLTPFVSFTRLIRLLEY